jgi:hypothetical protein
VITRGTYKSLDAGTKEWKRPNEWSYAECGRRRIPKPSKRSPCPWGHSAFRILRLDDYRKKRLKCPKSRVSIGVVRAELIVVRV